MVHADRWGRGAGISGAGADEMPTTLNLPEGGVRVRIGTVIAMSEEIDWLVVDMDPATGIYHAGRRTYHTGFLWGR
jgi:hypothetical protein